MATLAAQRPYAGAAFMPRVPVFGTSGVYRASGGELHGRELRTLFDAVHEICNRIVELPRLISVAERLEEEDLSYNPVSPVRTYQATIEFVNIGPMPPMKLNYFDE
jgi:hypothetical protein